MLIFLYQRVLKPILFKFHPEDVHQAFVWLGEVICRPRIVRRLLGLFYGIPKSAAQAKVDGITYPSVLGLAAGFDYNGKLAPVLGYMGFGFEEVGSVTARPCEGNPKPRLTRLIRSQSILVYKGLRNDGVDRVIERLKCADLLPGFVLGISIAKTNDAQCATLEGGVADYTYSLKRLVEEDVGDFYTINVSCPNVHGGEDFAEPTRLRPLLESLRQVKHNRPMYLKLPINKTWDEFKPLVEMAREFGLNGVVIGNLNKDYDSLEFQEERPSEFRGGLSGRPCHLLSTELIRKTRELYPDNFTIIGCGGLLSVQDAQEKIDAGANLLQCITGMIFNGPHLMSEVAKHISLRP
jgi:dihydroorotate dehydrogenase